MPITTRVLILVSALSFQAVAQSDTTGAKSIEGDAAEFQPGSSWNRLGKNVWFNPKSRVLMIRAKVVLREGPLEHLLCRKASKEHESIFSADVEPILIHSGLLLTGAKPGGPVRFEPDFKPPSGTPIRIEVEWTESGKTHKVDARNLVKDDRAGKALDRDWVFAGSLFVDDPFEKKRYYAANDGDLFCVANFPASVLDVPFRSSSSDADRGYVAFTDRVPPMGTEVSLLLRPVTTVEKR